MSRADVIQLLLHPDNGIYVSKFGCVLLDRGPGMITQWYEIMQEND